MSGPEYRYAAFGLEIRSNRALGGLPPGGDGPASLTVAFEDGREPPAHSEEGADGGRLLRWSVAAGGPGWTMEVSPAGDRIEVRWEPGLSVTDMEAVVQTTGIATSLILRGVPVLHACAIDVGDRAVLMVGPAGAGKSTLAAAFVADGHRLLADDIAALGQWGGRTWVHPGGTRLRVHGPAASALSRDYAALPRVFETEWLEDKRYAELSAAEGTYCHEPRPVAAIYLLEGRDGGEQRIEALEPAAALPSLLRNTYGARLTDAGQRAALLPFWARLAQEVPVSRVRARDDLAALPGLVHALVAAAGSPRAGDAAAHAGRPDRGLPVRGGGGSPPRP